jgi:uncharacterized protein (DUF362 family)
LEKVIAGRSDSYDPREIKGLLESGFKRIGLDITGRSVLVKPNLLASKAPDRAATTHPDFPRALIELLIAISCMVCLGTALDMNPWIGFLRIGGYTGMHRGALGSRCSHHQGGRERRKRYIPYRGLCSW